MNLKQRSNCDNTTKKRVDKLKRDKEVKSIPKFYVIVSVRENVVETKEKYHQSTMMVMFQA